MESLKSSKAEKRHRYDRPQRRTTTWIYPRWLVPFILIFSLGERTAGNLNASTFIQITIPIGREGHLYVCASRLWILLIRAMWTIPHWSTIVVSTLVVFFVIGSWLNLSGIWIEFPLIVDELPEGWRLPAVMGLVANLANIGVVIIAVVRRFSRGRVTYEIPANIFILTTGTVVLVIIAFVWNKTTIFNGAPHSTYLMGLSLTLSLVDCTSSVTFLPFLDRYEPIYINAYFLGEALSSLFPALLGIAQGVGRTSCTPNANGTLVEYSSPPRFSVRTYFLALSVVMLASLLSFIVLCLTRIGRRQDKLETDISTIKFVLVVLVGQ